MKKCLLAAFVLLPASTALAQQSSQPSQPSQLEQRIATQVGALAVQNISLGLQIEQLQAALAAAQARVKELEAAKENK